LNTNIVELHHLINTEADDLFNVQIHRSKWIIRLVLSQRATLINFESISFGVFITCRYFLRPR